MLFLRSTGNYPTSAGAISGSVSGAGDWYSKTVTVSTGFNTKKIYFVNMTATVDSVNPLSAVSFSGATTLWQAIHALKNQRDYTAFIQPTSSTIVMTISSPYANTDRYYYWAFYPYRD